MWSQTFWRARTSGRNRRASTRIARFARQRGPCWGHVARGLVDVGLSQRELARRTRLGIAAGRLEPFAHALVDLGVVEQREVVGASYVMSVLVAEGDPPSLALTACAGH